MTKIQKLLKTYEHLSLEIVSNFVLRFLSASGGFEFKKNTLNLFNSKIEHFASEHEGLDSSLHLSPPEIKGVEFGGHSEIRHIFPHRSIAVGRSQVHKRNFFGHEFQGFVIQPLPVFKP